MRRRSDRPTHAPATALVHKPAICRHHLQARLVGRPAGGGSSAPCDLDPSGGRRPVGVAARSPASASSARFALAALTPNRAATAMPLTLPSACRRCASGTPDPVKNRRRKCRLVRRVRGNAAAPGTGRTGAGRRALACRRCSIEQVAGKELQARLGRVDLQHPAAGRLVKTCGQAHVLAAGGARLGFKTKLVVARRPGAVSSGEPQAAPIARPRRKSKGVSATARNGRWN